MKTLYCLTMIYAIFIGGFLHIKTHPVKKSSCSCKKVQKLVSQQMGS